MYKKGVKGRKGPGAKARPSAQGDQYEMLTPRHDMEKVDEEEGDEGILPGASHQEGEEEAKIEQTM